MAKLVEITKGNDIAVFQRLFAAPLDNSQLYDTLEDAKTYAAKTTDTNSYVGQIIVVTKDTDTATEKKNGVYEIVDEVGTLRRLLTDVDLTNITGNLSDEVAKLVSGLENTGYQGTLAKVKELVYNGTGLKRGMVFNILASELEATELQKYVNGLDVEAGDWLVVKADVEASEVGKEPTNQFGVWEKNLTGAVTSIADGVAETGKYISAVTKNGAEISFTHENLPVKEVEVTGSGNVITDVTYDNTDNKNKLSITKGKIPTANILISRSVYGTDTDAAAAMQCYTAEVNDDGQIIFNFATFHGTHFSEGKAIGVESSMISNDTVMVFLNGVLLRADSDYSIKPQDKTIVFPKDVADKDDVITVTMIIPE